jgi:hypothetical protein
VSPGVGADTLIAEMAARIIGRNRFAASRRRTDALSRIRRVARLMDRSFRVPGTRFRFGLDAVIGLVPALGDAAGMVVSAWIVVQSLQFGVRGPTLVRMLFNLGVDALAGTVPIAGDAFDAWFKANSRNLRLLERHLSAGRGVVSQPLGRLNSGSGGA